jgi:hypothetical protein
MPKSKPRKPAKSKRRAKPRETPGPKPDILRIEGDWQDAIKKSLQKKKPAKGWPK